MRSSIAASLEEVLQQRHRFFRKYASNALNPMVESGILMNFIQASTRASLGVVSAPHHSFQASVD
jgi:hypothetical protein